ncbi:MAG: hypothetical protein VZR56_02290 [Treponema sp.]|nr:hypothetical protein [Treponema sp.]
MKKIDFKRRKLSLIVICIFLLILLVIFYFCENHSITPVKEITEYDKQNNDSDAQKYFPKGVFSQFQNEYICEANINGEYKVVSRCDYSMEPFMYLIQNFLVKKTGGAPHTGKRAWEFLRK